MSRLIARLTRTTPHVLRALTVAACYFAAAELGLLLSLVNGQISPLWPPTGIAVGALLLLGPRTWPGILLGALLVNAPLGPTPAAVAAIAAGNTLAPLLAYLLLRRVGFHTALDRFRDALALVFLAALTGMLVSATVGSTALLLTGTVTPAGFAEAWSVWWTGDAMGVLVVTPVLLSARRARRPRNVPWRRWAEAVALLTILAAVACAATRPNAMLFLVFPFIVWAAMRFHHAGASVATLIVSVTAIRSAAEGTGPFAGYTLLESMWTLQAYNAAAALTALLLAAVTVQRDQAHFELRRAYAKLTGAVARLRDEEP